MKIKGFKNLVDEPKRPMWISSNCVRITILSLLQIIVFSSHSFPSTSLHLHWKQPIVKRFFSQLFILKQEKKINIKYSGLKRVERKYKCAIALHIYKKINIYKSTYKQINT